MSALLMLAAAVGKEHDQEQQYPGLVYINTEFIDHRRWVVSYLDIYFHQATDTYAGVLYDTPATECQEGSEGEPSVVAVERDPTPHFRIKRTPR